MLNLLSWKKNILRDGIQDPLKVWNGTLIDGHNRYTIAQKHNLSFSTVEMQFKSRDDAVIWIIKNQFGRRNLTIYDRSLLALKLKPVIAEKARENSLANLKQNTMPKEYQIKTKETSPTPKYFGVGDTTIKNPEQSQTTHESETNSRVAKLANVSAETIRKVEVIEEKADEEIKQARTKFIEFCAEWENFSLDKKEHYKDLKKAVDTALKETELIF
jgi:hypothetical protein